MGDNDDVKKQKTAASSGAASSQDPRESDGVNHWPLLSDEVVVYILGMLPQEDLVKSSLIDRRFGTLSRDVSLWTELTLDIENIKQNAESCRKLVDRCKKLSSLKIKNNRLFWGKLNIMTVVTRAKERLRCLEISSAIVEWTPAAMVKLGSLRNLTSLAFSFCPDPNAVNLYKGANMLEELKNLDQLEVLQLRITRDIPLSYNSNSLPVMKRVFKQLKKLKRVDIRTRDYDDSLVVTLAENNPNLRALCLKDYPSLSEETVDVLAKFCLGLEELAIGFSRGNSAINKLSSSFPNLKRLEIGRTTDTTDEKLTQYVEAFMRLESLDLPGYTPHVTESGIERMVSSAENLKHFGISRAPRVTSDLVKRLRTVYPGLDLRINHS